MTFSMEETAYGELGMAIRGKKGSLRRGSWTQIRIDLLLYLPFFTILSFFSFFFLLSKSIIVFFLQEFLPKTIVYFHWTPPNIIFWLYVTILWPPPLQLLFSFSFSPFNFLSFFFFLVVDLSTPSKILFFCPFRCGRFPPGPTSGSPWSTNHMSPPLAGPTPRAIRDKICPSTN